MPTASIEVEVVVSWCGTVQKATQHVTRGGGRLVSNGAQSPPGRTLRNTSPVLQPLLSHVLPVNILQPNVPKRNLQEADHTANRKSHKDDRLSLFHQPKTHITPGRFDLERGPTAVCMARKEGERQDVIH